MKSRSSHLKYHPDPAAWVLPGDLNARQNCVLCKRGLATISGEVNEQFIGFLIPFNRAQRHVFGGKVGQVT
jgi:hypothetical protein